MAHLRDNERYDYNFIFYNKKSELHVKAASHFLIKCEAAFSTVYEHDATVSRTFHWLHVFCASRWLQGFRRFPLITRFPALAACQMFSHFFWLLSKRFDLCTTLFATGVIDHNSPYSRYWIAYFLYGFLPDLRGQLISLTYHPGPRDPKRMTDGLLGLGTRQGIGLALACNCGVGSLFKSINTSLFNDTNPRES